MFPKADLQQVAAELESDVRYLAETIGERNMGTEGSMDASADWIEQKMEQSGYHTHRQTYTLADKGAHGYAGMTADNIVAELSKASAEDSGALKQDSEAAKTATGASSNELIVIGAHYDTVPTSPGANDNASAIAVLSALAKRLSGTRPTNTVRLVAFANEEPPFFTTSDMGSYAYAARCRERRESVGAMIALDGVGYFSDRPGSQHYPVPGLGFYYPDRANFIGFVTRLRDRALLRRALKAFRSGTDLPVEGAALPSYVPGVYWSDHWSFWQQGYPGLLVTDTLPFRDPHYHSPTDIADRLDYSAMARVVEGVEAVVRTLAGIGESNQPGRL